MRRLHLSETLSLPADAVTQTFGILGKRGSGKTNAGRVMAEEFFAGGLPFCVIDPVGAWWGLRSSRDGKGPGLSLPIFGGDHGDIPLEREAGPLLADLVAEQRLSCVFDLSLLSEGEKTRFLSDFAERLFLRNRDPLHLFLEEADDFIPQRFSLRGGGDGEGRAGNPARLVGAWQRVVKRGRARGLGVTMLTQRSAAIHKDVLTQCETLLVFRTTAPQDMKAIEGWLQYHGQKTDVLSTLPSLRDGEAWIWSPHWLEKLVRVQLRLSSTFDSGATPTDVRGRRAPATLADVDLAALRERMVATIERAKDTDPKELRRQLAEVRAELARTKTAAPAPVRVEVPVLDPALVHALTAAVVESEGLVERTHRIAEVIAQSAGNVRQALDRARQAPARPVPQPTRRETSGRRPALASTNGAGEKLGGPQRKILTVLAQYPDGRTVTQVAILAGYAVDGGGFRNPLGALRSAGYVEGQGVVRITDAGLRALGTWEPLPAPGRELLDYWLQRVSGPEREILRVLSEVYPRALTPVDLAARTRSSRGDPYDPEGGGFRNPLGRLRTLELIKGRSEIKLSDDLMDGAR